MSYHTTYDITPDFEELSSWDTYCKQLDIEYKQSVEEGLDIEKYKDVFLAVHNLEHDRHKVDIANVLYDIIKHAETRADYKYNEPSTLEEIKALRKPYEFKATMPADAAALQDKVSGAWYGRICGCLLGKTVEGMKRKELIPFLKESGNYPMHRYIYSTDLPEDVEEKYEYALKTRFYADKVLFAPWDDDTNYVVMAQMLVKKNGRDFTPEDVMKLWVSCQPKTSYCTAERVSYLNYLRGYHPPICAVYKNPYREWIGAQIRGDYFGYINPGNPELAAEMAWRDASISHVKNGIYGEMFIAAMIAVAAVNDNIKDIIYGGLAEIPATSRLYESIMTLIAKYDAGVSKEAAFDWITAEWDDDDEHDWCHTISNALIVVASLLYGEGDYSKSICMSVDVGFDTDCNGATVGSILGMRGGEGCIDEYWKTPTHGILDTTVVGAEKSPISKLVEKTMLHMPEGLYEE
ncbi:MAG: ADP-ribosylglycohydrolase family protein [Clostridia bacterium]|nr:ADP-ribosylglycohydrolase family protein [Clostridia bacterium]MBQ8861474.1 ADP-ribosylglycohydrolase family protein [Clostridia bacterium]